MEEILTLKVLLSPLVNVRFGELNEAVVTSDPVEVATLPPDPVFTVIGNVDPSPFVNVIVFKFTDAVTSNEPVDVDPPTPVNPLPFPINDPENCGASTDVAFITYVDMLYYC
jgi:hypothetical protein